MKIVCVGGGPAGLYFAILAKLGNPSHEVTVFERNPAGVTYGWGVVFWDDLLDDLFRTDPVSARQIWDSANRWNEYEVRVQGQPTAYLGGYGFSVGRHRLLEILANRTRELGVDLRFEDDVDELPEADLIVAADGVNSKVRRRLEDRFGTAIAVGCNKYTWLGTSKVFDTFVFGFEPTSAGWIWFHAYPFSSNMSTFIVECAPETWEGLGLDRLEPEAGIAVLERIFASHLDGHGLVSQTRGQGTMWLNFKRIINDAWHFDNVVLLGDAAHTTHFAIGSGTKLAMQDAIGLAEQLTRTDELDVALQSYADERRAEILSLQASALSSSEWFEELPRYVDQPATQFAYSLLTRRGEFPRWRYVLHIATQGSALRRGQRWLLSGRKWARSRRRAMLARTRQNSVPPAVAVHNKR